MFGDTVYVNMDKNQRNFNSLNDIYQKIREIFSNFKLQSDVPIEKVIQIYSNDNNLLKEISVIEDSLSEIADILAQIGNKELFYFLSIRHMIGYILKDVKLFIIYMPFVDNLLINFFKFIHSKLIGDNDYEENDEIFADFLEEQKDYFYDNIFEYTGEYEDLMIEVTNILW